MRATQFNIILLSFLTLISIGFIHCTGTSLSEDSDTAVLTITGNVNTPQVTTSSSISALVSDIEEVDADESDALDDILTSTGEQGCSVEMYTLEGLLVCTGVTGGAGEYACPISDLNDIRPTSVTDPTASFRPQLVVTIDCGGRIFETFVDGKIVPPSADIDPTTVTTELADNELTIKTTLAMQSLMAPDVIGFTAWGADYTAEIPNPGQRYLSILGFFKNGSISSESGSLSKQFGILNALLTSFYVGNDKGDSKAAGYNTPYEMMKAMLKGEMSADAISRMTTFLADNFDIGNAATVFSEYSIAAGDLASTRESVYQNFIDAGLASDDTDKEEFYALGKTYGAMAREEATTRMRDGGSVTFEFIRDTYRTAATQAASAGVDPATLFNQKSTAGFLAAYGSDMESYMTNTSLRENFIDTMYTSAMNTTCTTFTKCKQLGTAYKTVYDAQGLDYCSTGACYSGLSTYIRTTTAAGSNIANYIPTDTSYFESGAFESCTATQIAAGSSITSCMGWLSNSQQTQFGTYMGATSPPQQPQLKADGQACELPIECLSSVCSSGVCGGQQQQLNYTGKKFKFGGCGGSCNVDYAEVAGQQGWNRSLQGGCSGMPTSVVMTVNPPNFSGTANQAAFLSGNLSGQPGAHPLLQNMNEQACSATVNGNVCQSCLYDFPPEQQQQQPPQNIVLLRNCAAGCRVDMAGNAPGPSQPQGFNITNALDCAGLPANVNVSMASGPPVVLSGALNLFTATYNGAVQNHPTDATRKMQPCNGVLQGQACGQCNVDVPTPPPPP